MADTTRMKTARLPKYPHHCYQQTRQQHMHRHQPLCPLALPPSDALFTTNMPRRRHHDLFLPSHPTAQQLFILRMPSLNGLQSKTLDLLFDSSCHLHCFDIANSGDSIATLQHVGPYSPSMPLSFVPKRVLLLWNRVSSRHSVLRN